MVATVRHNMKLRRSFLRYLPFARQKHIYARIVRLQRIHRGWQARLHLAKVARSAASIQSLPRLVHARRHVAQKRSALAIIQAGMHSLCKRRVYAQQRRQLISLQATMRGFLVRRAWQEKRAAVTYISRVARGHRVRKQDHRVRAASTTIGSVVRSWVVNLHFQRQRQAAAIIQKRWRKIVDYRRIQDMTSAATQIASQWRACCCRHEWKRRRAAGAYLVTAAWMWKHMHTKKRKIFLATKIAARWRGYCVRVNQLVLRSSANKIRNWWHNRKAYEETLWVVFEVMLAKKRIRDEYYEKHAIVIQRFARTWLRWRHGMGRVKRMVLSMQSRYRSWGPKRDVEMLRIILGPHVKRLPSQLVALVNDKFGRFTRYRAFRTKERVCPHVARIVRLKVLPFAFRQELSHVVGKIQAFLKHRVLMRKIRSCQAFVRGWLARTGQRKRQNAARVLQRAWRRKKGYSIPDLSFDTAASRSIVLVQAYTRGFLDRKKVEELKKLKGRGSKQGQLTKEEGNA